MKLKKRKFQKDKTRGSLFASTLLPHLNALNSHTAGIALTPRGEPVVDALVEGAGREVG
jgi:hypothetical protein